MGNTNKPHGIVYLSGPITGVPNYWEAFEKAEDQLTSLGWAVLSPAKHPQGLTNEQYMRMDFAMIDVADVVLFLPGWEKSSGACLERAHCGYIEKPVTDDIDKLEEVLRR
jgi:nucleoside 2-deoxyribosyltransferase